MYQGSAKLSYGSKNRQTPKTMMEGSKDAQTMTFQTLLVAETLASAGQWRLKWFHAMQKPRAKFIS